MIEPLVFDLCIELKPSEKDEDPNLQCCQLFKDSICNY